MNAKAIKLIYRITMAIQSIMWIVFAAVMLIHTYASTSVIINILMIANGITFFVFLCLSEKKIVILRILSFLFLLVNLVLTITDQMGIFDYIVLGLNILAVFTLLYITIKSY